MHRNCFIWQTVSLRLCFLDAYVTSIDRFALDPFALGGCLLDLELTIENGCGGSYVHPLSLPAKPSMVIYVGMSCKTRMGERFWKR